MATESSTSVSKTAIQKLPEFTEFDPAQVQLSLEQFKSLAPLDLETSKYGKITVDVAALQANTAKIQKAQKLYLEALEFYECGMVNLAFEVCKDAINLKSEDQLTNSLLGKLLEKIQNKRDEEKYTVLTDKEKEFSNEIIESEQEIRKLKKESGSLNNEQKFKIYSRLETALDRWGRFLASNEEKRYIKSVKIYKKLLNVEKIRIELSPDEEILYIHQALTHNNIGLNYLDLKVYSKALTFFNIAINLFEKIIEKANRKKDFSPESLLKLFAKTYKNIAHVNKRLGEGLSSHKKYKEALIEYEQGFKMMKKARSIYECDEFFEWLGVLYQGALKATAKIVELNKAKK